MSSYSLTIVGSASGLPEPDRSHAALALHRPGEMILFDAGEGVCSALLRCGLDPLQVKKIFITHTHPDHCVGIFMLLQYQHMRGHQGVLDIYLPKGTLNLFQQFMNQLYLVPKEINPVYNLKLLKAQHVLGRGWVLDTFPTQHLQRWQELEIPGLITQSYALRLHAKTHALFYSSDISSLSDIQAGVQKNDLLVMEGAHIDFSQVLDWAAESGLKRIILTHCLPTPEGVHRNLVRQARKRSVQLIFARDGLSLAI